MLSIYAHFVVSIPTKGHLKKNRTLSVPSIQKLTLHFYPQSSDPPKERQSVLRWCSLLTV